MSNSNTTSDSTKSAVGTGAGAVVGAAAGAALGTVIPGVGNVVGAVIGGAIGLAGGAAAGKAIADSIDPKVEDDYWRKNHSKNSFASGSTYDEYGPAYRYGWETRGKHPISRSFSDVESDLGKDWDRARGSSKLAWDRAKHASKAAWNRVEDRVERAIPGDSDGDGK